LRDELPDDYLVYHSVHWSKSDPKRGHGYRAEEWASVRD
jgi:hypothetical protein